MQFGRGDGGDGRRHTFRRSGRRETDLSQVLDFKPSRLKTFKPSDGELLADSRLVGIES
jgi:hypothetical protein